MKTLEKCVEAMESVTVETVTARLVGMEINVNSSVTSAHGRVSGDAHLQMARSAATEAHVYVASALAMMWIPQETGATFTERPASVTREAAMPCTTDTRMISVQVTASVTVAGATARKVGLERNAIILSPARCLWKPVRRSVGEPPACPALAEGSVCAASAHATHPEINAYTARTVSVTTGSVRT